MANSTVREAPVADRRASASETVPARQVLTLTLRPQPQHEHTHRVTWEPNVQEAAFQRVSKCCCVFHKKRLFGESESDTSSSSSSDDDGDNGGAGPADGNAAGIDAHGHVHNESDGCCGAESSNPAPAGQASAVDGTTMIIRKKPKRPRCTKAHCYCGTRFS